MKKNDRSVPTPPGSEDALTDEILEKIGRLNTLEALWIGGNQVSEAGLKNLAGLYQLKHLEIMLFRCQGSWLKPIASLTELEKLQVAFPMMVDEDLKTFSSLVRLKSLQIHIQVGSRITDAGLAHLANLAELTQFQLDRAEITTEGLQSLRGMTHLERLTLAASPNLTSLEPLRPLVHLQSVDIHGSPRVDNSGVAVLSAFPDLSDVSLSGTQVTDAGLNALRGSKKLELLALPSSATDEGLTALADLKSLRMLILTQTRVTPAAAKKFQAAHPGLYIQGP